MTTNINLAMAPGIKIRKGSAVFEIGEVPAIDLIEMQEACASMDREGFEKAIKTLFKDEAAAKTAIATFTFADIGQIIRAIVRRDLDPLVNTSSDGKAETSPSENA